VIPNPPAPSCPTSPSRGGQGARPARRRPAHGGGAGNLAAPVAPQPTSKAGRWAEPRRVGSRGARKGRRVLKQAMNKAARPAPADAKSAGPIALARRLVGVGESPRTPETHGQGISRLLLTRQESACALGMSLRHFQRHVQPHLPCIYSGQLRLFRPEDLERWMATEAGSSD
jgi:hypothetical protein